MLETWDTTKANSVILSGAKDLGLLLPLPFLLPIPYSLLPAFPKRFPPLPRLFHGPNKIR